MGSVKTRKVSTQSLQSTTSAEDTTALSTFINLDDTPATAHAAAGADAACDDGPDTQTDLRDAGDDTDCCRSMPWIKVLSIN